MHDWRKIILEKTETMQRAIEVLNAESLQIVLVADEENRLLGTITDGDIRRGLLKHHSIETALSIFMNREPISALATDSSEKIFSKMRSKHILQIPVLDEDGRIVGLETLQHLLKKRRYDNPVFLMAGGFGKRLHPLTHNIPKPLLKVGGKPILETILDQFIDAGFSSFYISTHYKAEMIRDYFGDGHDWGVSIQYVHEEAPLGTAGSLGLLPDNMPKIPLVMMNGDLLTKIDFQQLLNFHVEQGGDITMCVREYDFQVPYGVVETNKQQVTSIVEKPVHKFFVNAGIYVLNPSVLKNVDGEISIDMPQLIEKTINTGGKVNVFPVHEYWLDIGQKSQYVKAQHDLDGFHREQD